MESNIFYDLDDDEKVLWCSMSHRKSHNKKTIILTFILIYLISIVFFASFFMISGKTHLVLGIIVLVIAFVLMILFYTIYLPAFGGEKSKKEKREFFYYITNKKVIICKETKRSKTIRYQYLRDIKSLEVSPDGNSLFFSPATNITVYEMDYRDIKTPKEYITINAPMVFLEAENIDDALVALDAKEADAADVQDTVTHEYYFKSERNNAIAYQQSGGYVDSLPENTRTTPKEKNRNNPKFMFSVTMVPFYIGIFLIILCIKFNASIEVILLVGILPVFGILLTLLTRKYWKK